MNQKLIVGLGIVVAILVLLATNNDDPGGRSAYVDGETVPDPGVPELAPSQDPMILGDDVQPTTIQIFTPTDNVTTEMLTPWLTDIFLAEYDVPESIIRTGFLSVDAEELQLELTRSLRAGQVPDQANQASTELNLFPDHVQRIVVNRYRLGSTGFKNFGASVVGATGPGREYFQFEIAPDGRVFGRGVASSGSYVFHPTPDPTTVLILEIDEYIAHKGVRLD